MAFRIFFIIILFLLFPQVSLAQSNYVLPYPSGMPGSLSYKFHLLYENASRYWYFGDFGQFDYNLKMTDKYLVEAKTLFEYKQYLLGYKALKKSDFYFPNILFSLAKAKNNNKDISQKKIILKQAMLKHIETLERMEVDTPDTFNWQPEKALPTTLDIKTTIERAINIRKNVP
ncbi:MAG: hypothetical protein US45_C0001G0002 [Candidatus Nomurabacteria bacterium GW2011_GWA1_37_20]|uniref:DUF5667 domain-containing protein n=1 Tax=Candidatus Nomurabacteria bacterium GW2011_GWA1_37_20 TaxID=1618729 RepID=A0A0G0GSA6_9BACT|nr:MAG: hypothetical protein US33_C0015G0003 [Parcubacteria group bacterium GW2011_GWC1_36_9]KKQ33963.1 MAG: hypothetical protein US45_C0001G0002 [Candidatus Nomurabacteria bacterium GW2011_GWA1_37_20]KKQ33997.1 MAG: hypothetical protein US48_C0004G0003 [Candidatus Levybacteria bacterium GW2011_GWA2_37_36]KKQ38518.1 MAG: hypothetical protein US55_C0005G0015 [Candidatus Levybacteria bacterium GW2011_GWC2_37_7]KKQ42838.1 MAG: hypothetical protein US59_C0003G0003 [Candidatus Levybacteria bacterium